MSAVETKVVTYPKGSQIVHGVWCYDVEGGQVGYGQIIYFLSQAKDPKRVWMSFSGPGSSVSIDSSECRIIADVFEKCEPFQSDLVRLEYFRAQAQSRVEMGVAYGDSGYATKPKELLRYCVGLLRIVADYLDEINKEADDKDTSSSSKNAEKYRFPTFEGRPAPGFQTNIAD